MSVSFTNLTVGNATGSLTSTPTASLSPASNTLLLLTVSQRTGITADPNQPTATGNGLTWVVVNSIVFDTTSSSRRRVTVLRALGSSPSSGAVTIDCGGQTQTDIVWSVDQVNGVDLSGTNGSGAIIQSAANKDETLTASALTVTLSPFSDARNASFGGFSTGNDTDGHSAGSGFTLLGVSPGPGVNGLSTNTEFQNGTATAITMNFTSGVQFGGVAMEIKASPAGANLIQSSGTANLSVGSTSVSWNSSTTSGNLVVVGVSLTNAAVLGTVSSITDVQGNTYQKALSGTISTLTDVLNVELWYGTNIIGGAGSVTIFHTIDACAIYAREYTGFNTLDVLGSASGSSTTPNSGTSGVTSVANELIVVATGDDKGASQTWTAAGSYGDIVGTATTLTGLSMEDNIVSATGAQIGTLVLGSSANWESLLASFKNVGVAGGIIGYKSLLGVGQ